MNAPADGREILDATVPAPVNALACIHNMQGGRRKFWEMRKSEGAAQAPWAWSPAAGARILASPSTIRLRVLALTMSLASGMATQRSAMISPRGAQIAPLVRVS